MTDELKGFICDIFSAYIGSSQIQTQFKEGVLLLLDFQKWMIIQYQNLNLPWLCSQWDEKGWWTRGVQELSKCFSTLHPLSIFRLCYKANWQNWATGEPKRHWGWVHRSTNEFYLQMLIIWIGQLVMIDCLIHLDQTSLERWSKSLSERTELSVQRWYDLQMIRMWCAAFLDHEFPCITSHWWVLHTSLEPLT